MTAITPFCRHRRVVLAVVLFLLWVEPLWLAASVIPGDLTGNCQVDIEDLAVAAVQWLEPTDPVEPDLLAYWPFDAASGQLASDASGRGYTAMVVGARWNPHGGRLGGALQFNGVSNYLWVTQGFQGITADAARTCVAWIRTDQADRHILTWGDPETAGGAWLIGLDTAGRLCLDIGGELLTGSVPLTDNRWHHIVVTLSGPDTDGVGFFVDGRPEPVTGPAEARPIDTRPSVTAKIGVYLGPHLSGRYFAGLIDEARIYQRALNDQEIARLAASGRLNFRCADFNADRFVDLTDLAVLAGDWGVSQPPILISEIMADNAARVPPDPGQAVDGHLQSSDWIELYNNSQQAIDLSGACLTDDPEQPDKWRFPVLDRLKIPPGGYLVVFASGKKQADFPDNYPYIDPAGYLHTNFKLSKDGEYLALFAPDGVTPVHALDGFVLPDGRKGFPPQKENISFGWYFGELTWFARPTAGGPNRESFLDTVKKPAVSVPGGCYDRPFELVLSCQTAGADILYTTDGTVPTLTNGQLYRGPIPIDSSVTLLARAFKPGLRPSDTRVEPYLFIEPAVAAFSSNLPIVVVDTLGAEIPSDKVNRPYVPCRLAVIDIDPVSGRARLTGTAQYEGWGQIRRRGESTYNSHHYALELHNEYRQDTEAALLDMPAESDWILTWDVIDYTMMKNLVAYDWFARMGHYAPRQRYVELYLQTGRGPISADDYLGLFILREKIKRDNNRVDITGMDAADNLEPEVTGGYIIKSDKYNEGDTLLTGIETAPYNIQTNGAGKPIVALPKPDALTAPQLDWIQDYLSRVNAVLWHNTASIHYPGPQAHYRDYLDIDSWIDHGLLEQVACDSDAFWGSYYVHKDRNGRIVSGPPWDYDRSFHNNAGNYDTPWDTWKANSAIFGKWHQRLQQDPEYQLRLADRWFAHRKYALDTGRTWALIDQAAEQIREARSRPKKHYPKPFDEEIGLFKTWIGNRLDWLDGEIARRFAPAPPRFSVAGGYIAAGQTLTLTGPPGASGTVYYTLDGSDPRLPGGGLNPDARVFAAGEAATEVLVAAPGSLWHYRYADSAPGDGWQTPAFDDSAWPTGPGQLGFGDQDEATDIGPRVAGRRAAWFRHRFSVADPAAVTALTAEILYDDGAVVYLNGTEIGRLHMPDGTITTRTLANGNSSDNKTASFTISSAILDKGANLLAVEVHQNADNSSDLSFDLTVRAIYAAWADPIPLDDNPVVTARVRDGSHWSALGQERYALEAVPAGLRITELMYHPPDPNAEFVELSNLSDRGMNLNRVRFDRGIEFTFGPLELAPGASVVLVKDPVAFARVYPAFSGMTAGRYTGSLDNGGERLRLLDPLGRTLADFDYDDRWYPMTDGEGHSLVPVDPAAGDSIDWSSPHSWSASTIALGTPGIP